MKFNPTEVLKEFDEAFVPAYYLRGNHKKAKESLSRALQKAYEAGETHGAVKERERLQPVIEIAESIADLSAFDQRSGHIWQHWIDEAQKRVEALQGDKKESRE